MSNPVKTWKTAVLEESRANMFPERQYVPVFQGSSIISEGLQCHGGFLINWDSD